MRKKIVNTEPVQPKVTLEPFFDTLNDYLKDVMHKRKTGKQSEQSKEVIEALRASKTLECQEHCESCRMGMFQFWINELNLRGVDNLCDLVDKIWRKKLRRNKSVDLMDVGMRLPGSGFSNQ